MNLSPGLPQYFNPSYTKLVFNLPHMTVIYIKGSFFLSSSRRIGILFLLLREYSASTFLFIYVYLCSGFDGCMRGVETMLRMFDFFDFRLVAFSVYFCVLYLLVIDVSYFIYLLYVFYYYTE